MPGHGGPTINAVEGLDNNILIQVVDQVRTPMSRVCVKLIGYKAFEELYVDCKICLINPDTCGRMKKCLQPMMNEGLVQIGYTRKLEDVSVIKSHGHTPFEIPYHKMGAPTPFHILVPMSSQTSTHILVPTLFLIPFQILVKSEDPIVFRVPAPFSFKSTKYVLWNYNSTTYVGYKHIVIEPTITNIVGIGGMTWSGRVFAPEQQSKQKTSEVSKGK